MVISQIFSIFVLNKCEMKKINVIGEKFGSLQVLSEHSKTRNGHIRYTCKCDCGNTCTPLITHLRRGNTTHCGCKTVKKIGPTHPQWTGFGEISGNFWRNHIIKSANGYKRRKIEISITKEYAWKLFLKQDRKCALSGLNLYLPITQHKNIHANASLDRIDSSKGYIEGNVQWVHKDINLMKNKFTTEYFLNMCKLVYELVRI